MNRDTSRPLVRAGLVIGIGMGGFVDGIVFHQILQLHSMVSAWVPRDSLLHEQVNMFWDGMFHAFTWMAVAVGLVLLWRAVKRPGSVLSGRSLCGALAVGWGLFNLVEGAIDHEILGIHHVYENGNHLLWDVVFLASGVVLISVGWSMIAMSGRKFHGVQRES